MFRAESILLKSYWILVVMDVFNRRIIGFDVAAAQLDGCHVCRMFNRASAKHTLPRSLSSDHDPLFRYHRWRANLRVLDADEFKTVPCTPRSHAFVERLRCHPGLGGVTPARQSGAPAPPFANLDSYRWRRYCRRMFQTPIAA